jgi:hypothetical protein
MSRRIAGCDLGKASSSFAIASVGDGGEVVIEDVQYLLHEGKPLELFREWYREKDVASCAALGATGIYADELTDPVLTLPEDSCQEAALELQSGLEDSLNLVSIGARGYGILSRKPGGSERPGRNGGAPSFTYQYLENDKCSSGTGENIKKIAGRFGLSIEEADALAQSAPDGIPITARCSVFAKSEMTHFANQGKPTGEGLLRVRGPQHAGSAGAQLRRRPRLPDRWTRSDPFDQGIVRGTAGAGSALPAPLPLLRGGGRSGHRSGARGDLFATPASPGSRRRHPDERAALHRSRAREPMERERPSRSRKRRVGPRSWAWIWDRPGRRPC